MRQFGVGFLLLCFAFVWFSCSETKLPLHIKPNIIIIMADDMGYSDLGCTGSEIATPNLDEMAKNGALFTKFYNTSRCCPSRASLLTGQYQWDAGVGHMDNDNAGFEEYQGYLNEKCMTIAEALGDNGYQTFMSGKWHLGKERDKWPDKNGFDQFYGTPAGGGIYFYPSKFYKRDVFWNGKKMEPDSTWYSTDAFTDYAINYIKNAREEGKPFFMYLPYIAPHFPLQAKKEDIDKYRDIYKVGYDSIRMERLRRQQELGLVSEDTKISEATFPDWETVENKGEEALKMAVYAAMVDCMDQNIGRLLKALKEEAIADNTIVFFLSDNGGASVDFNKTPLAEIGTRNSNASYGKWYNVSNTPYRKFKATEHEGGIITPMIAYGLENSKGDIITEPAHITDFMPTCLELAGISYPKEYDGIPLDPLDGKSFLPLISGKNPNPDRTFFWEHEGNRAVRQGDWKLVALNKKEWELYKISEDPHELNNLTAQWPEVVNRLKLSYREWAKKHGVQAWPLDK